MKKQNRTEQKERRKNRREDTNRGPAYYDRELPYGYQKAQYIEMKRRKKRKREKQRRLLLGMLFLMLLLIVLLVILMGCHIKYQKNAEETAKSFEAEEGLYTDSLENLLERLENVDRSVVSKESLAVLDQRIEEAKVLKANNASQKELDQAYTNLVLAMQDLEYTGN